MLITLLMKMSRKSLLTGLVIMHLSVSSLQKGHYCPVGSQWLRALML